MLADDPKLYHRALEDLKAEEQDRGNMTEDHLFDDKYIITERTFKNRH